MKLLVLFDLLLAAIALIYDWSALSQLPLWLIPFIAICPLYPFLLAATWWQLAKKNVRPWLTAFAAVPAAMYGILALGFYPLVMQHDGFSYLNLLSIFWVWLYATQAWYLIARRSLAVFPTLIVSVIALAILVLQVMTNSYDYLAWATLTVSEKSFLLIVAISTIVIINAYLLLPRVGAVARRAHR